MMQRVSIHTMAITTVFASIGAESSFAQDPPRDVEVTTENVRDNIHVLFGQGGNIGVSVGEDGVFMIDDQYAPLTGKILEAVAALSDQPVKFLINTHWHGDHTGGNENLGKEGAIIVAHENVRRTMSVEQVMETFGQTVPASPPDALPVITFTEQVTFHHNGDEVRVIHVDPAHTDGDSFIHFVEDNVIHAGDLYFNGMYPFIDAGHGGSIDGMIGAASRILRLCDDDTKIIPGHGPLSGPRELRQFREMLRTVRESIAALIAEGKTKEEIIGAKPTAEFDAEWGDGFFQPDQFVGVVFDVIQKDRERAAAAHAEAGEEGAGRNRQRQRNQGHESEGNAGEGDGGGDGVR